jgi:hypothetical protein
MRVQTIVLHREKTSVHYVVIGDHRAEMQTELGRYASKQQKRWWVVPKSEPFGRGKVTSGPHTYAEAVAHLGALADGPEAA